MAYLNNPYLKSRINVVLDIETIPIVTDAIRAEVAASVVMPANISRPETVQAWEATRRPELIDAELARGGLFAERGRVLTFSYAINDDDPVCIYDQDERKLLETALGVIAQSEVVIGHNIVAYDLQFIRQRCWANGLPVPRKPFRSKAWDECIFDTLLAWSPDRDRRISLDKLCRVLGVKSPKASGFTGADVWPAYQAGKIDQIVEYALDDVVATRECWRKMQ